MSKQRTSQPDVHTKCKQYMMVRFDNPKTYVELEAYRKKHHLKSKCKAVKHLLVENEKNKKKELE